MLIENISIKVFDYFYIKNECIFCLKSESVEKNRGKKYTNGMINII